MKFVPYENFYIVTPLNPEEVYERLIKVVEPTKGFSFKDLFYRSSVYYFSGYVTPVKFELEPIINYRNSFIPPNKWHYNT